MEKQKQLPLLPQSEAKILEGDLSCKYPPWDAFGLNPKLGSSAQSTRSV